MKRSIVSALIVLVAVTTIVSVAYAVPREEIVLTTIIPDQTVLIVKKGVVGNTYRRAITRNPDAYPNNDLYVEGNVGIGTAEPEVKSGQSDFLDANDVSSHFHDKLILCLTVYQI